MTRSTAAQDATAAGPGRRADVALWLLQALTAVFFVMAGLGKLAGDPQTVRSFEEMGLGDLGRRLIGALELAGAVALLVPRLCGLAALAFTSLMIGAVVFSLTVFGPAEAVVPAAALLPTAAIAWTRRHRTAALLHRRR